ncbi:MAG: exosortase F system-associated protein [Flavobacteriaceae bacterium]|nr:exosortase F system-associated protein [Flavobacteriaceae bacterium]MDZ4148623.1 exosortase F system-associated protein [Flavobacteriaceae bacterium]
MKLSNSLRIVLILILGTFLISVRAFESSWFYDPFIAHFKQENYLLTVPEFDFLKLFFHLLFRYFINSFVSVLILLLIFDAQIVRFLTLLYLLFALLLIPIYMTLVKFYLPDTYTLFFYVRRFLIQPILLFVLIPAIYFREK